MMRQLRFTPWVLVVGALLLLATAATALTSRGVRDPSDGPHPLTPLAATWQRKHAVGGGHHPSSADPRRQAPPAAGPTAIPVYVNAVVQKMEKIDGVDQTFAVTFRYFYTLPVPWFPHAWFDALHPGEAFVPLTPENRSVFGNLFEFPDAASLERLRDDMYFVRDKPPWILGASDPATTLPDGLFTGAAWMMGVQRYQCTFKANLPLHDFPFDVQDVAISSEMTVPVLYYRFATPDVAARTTADLVDILEWELLGESWRTFDASSPGVPFNFSGVAATVIIKRNPSYYVSKIMVGIVFLVVMNWLLFALDVTDSNRGAVPATFFLPIVAYLFLVSSDVPKVAYSTRLDNFITASMVNIFLAFCMFQLLAVVHHAAVRAKEAAVAAAAEEAKRAHDAKGVPTMLAAHGVGRTREPIEAEAPTGWWDTWEARRRNVDIALLGLLILAYVVPVPLVISGSV